MAEYICREAILDDLEQEIEAGNTALDEDVWINKGLRIAIRDIKDLKSADVQPVEYGRWEDCEIRGSLAMRCSVCGNDSGVLYNYAYCTNCGARMDGDKANNVRNLTDEETEIYESWIDHEAKDTGVNIMDGDT
jgi:hypothetical protein